LFALTPNLFHKFKSFLVVGSYPILERMSDQYCASVIPGYSKVEKILEREHTLAFWARQPLWPVHAIVIPKQHITSIVDFSALNADIIDELLKAVAEVAQQVSANHGKCRVMTNIGEYQHTKHLHWHVYCESD